MHESSSETTQIVDRKLNGQKISNNSDNQVIIKVRNISYIYDFPKVLIYCSAFLHHCKLNILKMSDFP